MLWRDAKETGKVEVDPPREGDAVHPSLSYKGSEAFLIGDDNLKPSITASGSSLNSQYEEDLLVQIWKRWCEEFKIIL